MVSGNQSDISLPLFDLISCDRIRMNVELLLDIMFGGSVLMVGQNIK